MLHEGLQQRLPCFAMNDGRGKNCESVACMKRLGNSCRSARPIRSLTADLPALQGDSFIRSEV